jgi:hypothetical protein
VRSGRPRCSWYWTGQLYSQHVIAPSVIPGTTTSTAVNHYGLRATEEMLGLPLLGNAAGAIAAHRVPHLTRCFLGT